MVGHLHQPHRLAVALRPRHAEIVPEPAFGIGPALLADDANALAAEPAEAADDRLVLAKFPVAGERREIGNEAGDIVDAMRTLRMARDLRLLPRRKVRVELAQRVGRLAFDARDLFADLHAAGRLFERAQLLDLGFEFGNRLFKIEIGAHQIYSGLNSDR